jgi:hypothetical protein
MRSGVPGVQAREKGNDNVHCGLGVEEITEDSSAELESCHLEMPL